MIAPTTAHVDNKGIIDRLWRGEMICTGPKTKDADLWIMIWEEVHRIHLEGCLLEVEHIKAHRSEKEMQEMTLFERFVKDGNETADELARRRSTVGWRRDGADLGQHSSAMKSGSLRSMTVRG